MHVKEDTKHCATCLRCVDRFDHHCKWLNNCVGRKNYKIFICLLPVVSLTLVDLIIFKLIVIVNGFLYGVGIDQNLENLILAVLVLFLIIDTLGLIGIIYLQMLHFWLWVNGMTTYEFIVKKKKAKKIQKVKPKSLTSENSLNDYESARSHHKESNIPELEFLYLQHQKKNQTFQEGGNDTSYIEIKPPMSTRYSAGKGFHIQDPDLNDTIN
ncbi:unnamed protein product [Blepharisma stoltei]|uniref:Palmitoyltransferase n=1 Tax=Blepharisma stoltei TaxID=1481888 RepID=A0AAU9JNE6_9CILI|nr:unnamed protein product [Blepharisma stoltei]